MRVTGVLEFEGVRALIGRYFRSPLGRAELERLEPMSERAAIEDALGDVGEATEYLRSASAPQGASRSAPVRPRFEADVDPGPIAARLRIEGASLDATELYQLSSLLDQAADARGVLMSAGARYPRLGKYGAAIADLSEVFGEMRGKILPDGSLTDDASVALGRLRREAEKQRKLIEQSLERFLRHHQTDGTLQESFVTIRNDRFVVPIVSGKERRLDGVVHGSSSSGQTVFVEPIETIQLNNDLVRLRDDELREVHRILREWTANLRAHAKEILETIAAIGRLEFLFAKADYALDFQCAVPSLSPEEDRRIKIDSARHPLLADLFRKQRKRVVPISLTLDRTRRMLLISGPNTGGKTVTLKTVGLLAAMTHAGLPVPAAAAEFPLFDNVLADIGDHQSIQESLSSFSAHVVSVKTMLDEATCDSLVLVDELGRATDPEEGGALGVVVLETFQARGGFTLASTHLTAMKIYGASAEGVLNASMGFDEETLQPTYVLRQGAPGKSAGLDIASRLGIDAWMIDAARARMSSGERDVADFLAKLNDQVEKLQTERAAAAAKQHELDEREKSLEASWEKKYAAKIQAVERQAQELSQAFEERAQSTIEELSQKARAKIAKTKREFREALESAVVVPTSEGAKAPAAAPARLRLAEGARVRLKGVRQPATVRRLLSNGMIEVDAGFLKMQVPESDVEEVVGGNEAPVKSTGVSFRQGPSFDGGFREINLIGQRAEEACDQVDKLLDSAALAQVERIRIVHGHGMGILKRAIAELLRGNPHVEKFYPAPPQQGGDGATIVELK